MQVILRFIPSIIKWKKISVLPPSSEAGCPEFQHFGVVERWCLVTGLAATLV